MLQVASHKTTNREKSPKILVTKKALVPVFDVQRRYFYTLDCTDNTTYTRTAHQVVTKMASALGRAAMVGVRGFPAAGASRRMGLGSAGGRGLKTNPHVEVSKGRKVSLRVCILLLSAVGNGYEVLLLCTSTSEYYGSCVVIAQLLVHA